MRLCRLVAAVAAVVVLSACGSTGGVDRPAPTGEPAASASPSPREPRPEHDEAAVAAAVRRAVTPLAPPSKVDETGYEAGTRRQAQVSLCDAAKPLFAPPNYAATIDLRSFYSVGATSKPAAFRSGGQHAEAVGTLRVTATPLAETEKPFRLLADKPCRGGATHTITEPLLGTIGYRTTTEKASVGTSPAFVIITTADGGKLDKSGYYPLLGHVRVVTRLGGHVVVAEVLCARPARPREAATVTADARRQAMDLATRTVKELAALPVPPAAR
ncbi:hypothetical protein [Plantactinospora sp. GCM10030261]|uniref:hypothetical protein n=1 Tax=Plantactinospora sp. GCM10030261 TaxID=3273420 RepID=UPI00360B284D